MYKFKYIIIADAYSKVNIKLYSGCILSSNAWSLALLGTPIRAFKTCDNCIYWFICRGGYWTSSICLACQLCRLVCTILCLRYLPTSLFIYRIYNRGLNSPFKAAKISYCLISKAINYFNCCILLTGVVGVIWSVFWFALIFESPTFHPTITAEEKKYILEKIGPLPTGNLTVSRFCSSFIVLILAAILFYIFSIFITVVLQFQLKSVPWKAILQSKPVYAIIVANFARSWTFYLLLQNQLTYMKEVLGMKISDVCKNIHSSFIASPPIVVTSEANTVKFT